MKPSVGRIVHYGAERISDEPRAATIIRVIECTSATRVENPLAYYNAESSYSVSLLVHDHNLDMRLEHVPFSDTLKPGHWTWPPRTP